MSKAFDRPARRTATRARTVPASRRAMSLVNRTSRALPRTAAVLAWIPGAGFGLFAVPAIWYFAQHHKIWVYLGYPTYGRGPFEDIGIPTSIPLMVSFLLVCLAEIVLGWMLWRDHTNAPLLALALLPIEFAFWIGFSLPAGPLLGLARTAVVLTALFTTRTSRQTPRPTRRPDPLP